MTKDQEFAKTLEIVLENYLQGRGDISLDHNQQERLKKVFAIAVENILDTEELNATCILLGDILNQLEKSVEANKRLYETHKALGNFVEEIINEALQK